jgi:hypothetical protein
MSIRAYDDEEYSLLPLQHKPERKHLYSWMAVEELYVADKFDDQRSHHDYFIRNHDLDGFWFRQVVQYLDRARAFLESAQISEGVNQRNLELLAQQALAKGMMTFKGLVESSIRVYGDLPAPGVSSGEIKEWTSD